MMQSHELTLAFNRVNMAVRQHMEGTLLEIVGVIIDDLVADLHGRNVAAGWWSDTATGHRKARNVGEMLMLAVSEICEVPSGNRILTEMDDKLPHRLMFEVELADCIIRLFDTAGGTGVKLGDAIKAIFDRDMLPIGPFSPAWGDMMLMLPIRHLSDAMEANRKGRIHDYGIFIGRAVFDVFAIGIAANLDVPSAIVEKMEFNAQRADHKIENRKAEGGKKY